MAASAAHLMVACGPPDSTAAAPAAAGLRLLHCGNYRGKQQLPGASPKHRAAGAALTAHDRGAHAAALRRLGRRGVAVRA
eukprot:251779-Chlamydomonas_euryale.AAC.1